MQREREREKERDAVGGGNMLPRYGTRGDLGEQGLIQDQLKKDLADSLTKHRLLRSNGE